MYEKAAPFFDLAAQVEPQEVKWQLMVASCFRRTANHQQVSMPLHFLLLCEHKLLGRINNTKPS